MGQLSKATQQNASASEELAATSEELSGQAEQLQQSVAFFDLGEASTPRRGGRRTAMPRSSAAHPTRPCASPCVRWPAARLGKARPRATARTATSALLTGTTTTHEQRPQERRGEPGIAVPDLLRSAGGVRAWTSAPCARSSSAAHDHGAADARLRARHVINLRGSVVPVIDLHARFGREPATLGKKSCIVIFDASATASASSWACWSTPSAPSSASRVRHRAAARTSATSVRREFIRGMGKVGARFVILLDPDRALDVHDMAALCERAQEALAA
jgi:purine-binding chemotaxis protein CheW